MSDLPTMPPIPADDPDDPFAPERIDETIAVRLAPGAPADAATELLRGLAEAHALPPEADGALRRARARLDVAPLRAARVRGVRATTHLDLDTLPLAQHPARRQTGSSAGLRALAAVLVIGLLAAGFLTVLRLRAGPPTTGVAWQDAGISAAKARGGALEFDPARGVTYAVSGAAPGAVYVCGANHLWYSLDGGQTYQPFTPALPTGDTQQCAIATVPGAPGLFTDLPDPQAPNSGSAPNVVGYAMPGAARWQILRVPSSVQAYGAPFGVAVAADQLWTQIANNANGDQVRAVGNWLIMLLGAPGARAGPRYIIGTPDFGRTWDWLDRSLIDQGIHFTGLCTGLYVDPTTPTHLYCASSPAAPTRAADVFESRDGGKTWTATGLATMQTDPPSNSGNPNDPSYQFVDGADTQHVYVYAPSGQLLRRPLQGGNWQFVTGFTDQIQIVGATSDDSVYTVTRTYRHLQVLRLAPGATGVATYDSALTLSSLNDAVSFALGDIWPGGQPALYVRGTNQPSTHPFWRLALAPLASHAPVDTTPLPTVSAATPATVPTCPSSATGNLSAIQPGGLGADISTFAARWGPSQGTALGTAYFGRYADSGTLIAGVAAPSSNGRVFSLFVNADTANPSQQFLPTRAQSLAFTILPSDAVQQGQPQTVLNNGASSVVTYFCSAAFAAAFPAGTQAIAPLTGSGLIVVTDTLSATGNVTVVDLRAYGT